MSAHRFLATLAGGSAASVVAAVAALLLAFLSAKVILALLGVVLFLMATRFTNNLFHAFAVALIYGLGTMAFPYSGVLYQHQLAAAEDEVILKKIDPRENEIVTLNDAERAAFVAAMAPVLAKYRGTLDARLFEMLGGP